MDSSRSLQRSASFLQSLAFYNEVASQVSSINSEIASRKSSSTMLHHDICNVSSVCSRPGFQNSSPPPSQKGVYGAQSPGSGTTTSSSDEEDGRDTSSRPFHAHSSNKPLVPKLLMPCKRDEIYSPGSSSKTTAASSRSFSALLSSRSVPVESEDGGGSSASAGLKLGSQQRLLTLFDTAFPTEATWPHGSARACSTYKPRLAPAHSERSLRESPGLHESSIHSLIVALGPPPDISSASSVGQNVRLRKDTLLGPSVRAVDQAPRIHSFRCQ